MNQNECPVKNSINDNKESSCPIKHNNSSYIDGYSKYFKSLFFKHEEVKDVKSSEYNPAANDMHFNQIPMDGQKVVLSTQRTLSSIPKGEFTPEHQPVNAEKWVYPSEQQYFNAMKRKGFDPQEKDVPIILAIHNLVNEKGWTEVKQWEALRGNQNPKLKKFSGRPKDISPKAYLRSLLGYSLPFDRHDWIIERNNEEVRYVIDFYKGADDVKGAPISLHLDVRPALDSVSSLTDRVYVGILEKLGKTPLNANINKTQNSNSKS